MKDNLIPSAFPLSVTLQLAWFKCIGFWNLCRFGLYNAQLVFVVMNVTLLIFVSNGFDFGRQEFNIFVGKRNAHLSFGAHDRVVLRSTVPPHVLFWSGLERGTSFLSKSRESIHVLLFLWYSYV